VSKSLYIDGKTNNPPQCEKVLKREERNKLRKEEGERGNRKEERGKRKAKAKALKHA
jgi:hypothetical protein